MIWPSVSPHAKHCSRVMSPSCRWKNQMILAASAIPGALLRGVTFPFAHTRVRGSRGYATGNRANGSVARTVGRRWAASEEGVHQGRGWCAKSWSARASAPARRSTTRPAAASAVKLAPPEIRRAEVGDRHLEVGGSPDRLARRRARLVGISSNRPPRPRNGSATSSTSRPVGRRCGPSTRSPRRGLAARADLGASSRDAGDQASIHRTGSSGGRIPPSRPSRGRCRGGSARARRTPTASRRGRAPRRGRACPTSCRGRGSRRHAAVGLAFRVFVQHVDLGRRGIALGDRPVHPRMRPAHRRTVDRTRTIAIVAFEDGGEHVARLGARDEPEATRILERLRERTVIGLDRDVGRSRGEAITEPAVDDALGRAEDWTGWPISAASSSCVRIRLVRMPRRVCVGITPTAVTPATAIRPPPGTTMSNGHAAAVPTISLPS